MKGLKGRPIDKSKKSNIKCEHCKHWSGWLMEQCTVDHKFKKYYQRCKEFEWKSSLIYKDE